MMGITKKINLEELEDVFTVIQEWYNETLEYRKQLIENEKSLEEGLSFRLEIRRPFTEVELDDILYFLESEIQETEFEIEDDFIVDSDGGFVHKEDDHYTDIFKFISFDGPFEESASYDEEKKVLVIDIGMIYKYRISMSNDYDYCSEPIDKETFYTMYGKFLAEEDPEDREKEDGNPEEMELGGLKMTHVGEGAYCDDDGDNWDFL